LFHKGIPTLFGAKSDCSRMRSKAATRMRLMVNYRVSVLFFMLSQLLAVAVFDLIYLIRIIQHYLANILKSMDAKSPA